MKLKPTPLILLLAAGLLGLGLWWHEQNQAQRISQSVQSEQLFPFQEQAVQQVTIATPKESLAFSKAADSTGQSTWQMTAPAQAPAKDASVAYLLSLLTSSKRLQSLSTTTSQKPEFGLDRPSAIVEVTLASGTVHRLVLGKPNFNRTGLYAQVNPPAIAKDPLTVVLVPIDLEAAVARDLADWQQSPKPVLKPAPAPTPNSSPSPGKIPQTPSPKASLRPTTPP